MINQLLITIVNSVLGVGNPTSKGNYIYNCPICKHHKKKLEINFDESSPNYQNYSCWTCGGGTKGKTIYSLFKKLKLSSTKLNELKPFTKDGFNIIYSPSLQIVELPKEFKSLESGRGFTYNKALNYIQNRGINKIDIIKYNIGYCDYGRYKNMIILPSYDENGILNYFTGRSFEKTSFIKYKNPPNYSKDIIGLDLFINWDIPIILCEGILDAISIKRNAIPLMGKTIQSKLMKKLISSSVSKIYIALDKDAISQSLKYCEILMNEGKKIYFVDMEGKDPSDLGFVKFTQYIHNIKPFTFSNLFEKKLEMI